LYIAQDRLLRDGILESNNGVNGAHLQLHTSNMGNKPALMVSEDVL
jgi:hypothetical protein